MYASLIFIPVVSKICTKENDIADFISQNDCREDAELFFAKENIPSLELLELKNEMFDFEADW